MRRISGLGAIFVTALIGSYLIVTSGWFYGNRTYEYVGHISGKKFEYRLVVEATNDAELEAFSEQVADIFGQIYPEIVAIFGGSSEGIDDTVRLSYPEELEANGISIKNRIKAKAEWVRSHPTDSLGMIIHEIAHVVQQYPGGHPVWLGEGMADYIRHELEVDDAWREKGQSRLLVEAEARADGHNGTPGLHYTHGYYPATALLLYIEQFHAPGFIREAHSLLKSGNWRDSYFEEETGKDPEALWEELLRSLSVKSVDPPKSNVTSSLSPSFLRPMR